MRIALVSPYSWTLPGRRHAPHRGARRASSWPTATTPASSRRSTRPTGSRRGCTAARGPQRASCRTGLVSLGRTSASRQRRGLQPRRSRRTPSPRCAASCAPGGYDVVHIHEPVAPVVGWDALCTRRAAARRHLPHLLRERVTNGIAQRASAPGAAQPPARAHRRLRGRRLDRRGASTAAATGSSPTASTCRPSCPAPARRRCGRAAAPRVRRPGRRAQGPAGPAARLRGAARARPRRAHVVGADREEVAPLLLDGRGVTVLGKVSDAEQGTRRWRGRPAVRAVAGRRELRHGPHRGVRRRHAGRRLRHRRLPRRRARRRRRRARAARRRHRAGRGAARPRAGARARARRMAVEARAHAQRYAWPTVAGEVLEAYEDAVAVPRASTARERAGVFLGAVPADLGPRQPAVRRLPSLEAASARGAIAAARPPAGRHRPGRPRRRAAGPARAAAHRPGPDRRQPAARDADLGPARPRPDVRLDGRARRRLARDPHARRCPMRG